MSTTRRSHPRVLHSKIQNLSQSIRDLKSKIPIAITALVIAAFLVPVYSGPAYAASPAGVQPAPLPAPAAQDAPAAPQAPAAPEAVADRQVIVSEPFEKYHISNGLIYWAQNCTVIIPAPGAPQLNAAPAAPADEQPYYLRRKPTNGVITTTLTFFLDDAGVASSPPYTCHTFWGLFADSGGVYYYSFDAAQLEFRPSGDPFDPPNVVMSSFPAGTAPVDEYNSIRMATDAANVYWVGGANAVYRAAKDGSSSAPQLVASGLNFPEDILIVGSDLYIVDDFGLWRIDKDQCAGGGACAVTVLDNRLSAIGIGDAAANGGGGLTYRFQTGPNITAQADQIFWTAGNTIRRYSCSRNRAVPCTEALIRSAPDATWRLGAPSFSGDTMFWHEADTDLGDTGGVLRRAVIATPIDPLAVETIDEGIATTTSRTYIDGNFVYFADRRLNNFPPVSQISRQPLTSAAITRDLKADKFEITQGIQNTLNDVPLVAGKTTYVRAWGVNVAGPRANGVVAKLFGTRNGNPLPGSPLNALNGDRSLAPGTGYSRLNFYDGWLFQIPSSWISQGTTEFRVVVDPSLSFADPDRTNNTLTKSVNLAFQRPACAVYIPVRTHDSIPNTDFPNFWDMVGRFQRMWPIPSMYNYSTDWTAEEIDLCWWGPVPYPCGGPFELNETDITLRDPIPDKDEVIVELWGYNVIHYVPACDGILGGTHFMGMVNPYANTGNIAGYASTISSESWVKLPPTSPKPFPSAWDSMFEAGVMAQELAHNLGRKHVNCGGPDNVDNSYPYNTGTISSIPPQTTDSLHFGFDTKTRTAIAPNSTRDFMSYCGPTWTSDYTWRAILNAFAAAFASGDAAAPAAPDFSLIVSEDGTVLASGIVNVADDTGNLNYVKVVPEGAVSAGLLTKWMTYASAPVNASGAQDAGAQNNAPDHGGEPHQPNADTYFLRLLGPGGSQVGSDQEVQLSPIDDHTTGVDLRIFAATFPAPAQPVAKVQFMGDDKVIDEISVGAGEPTVQVTAPVIGATVTNQLTINWTATDPDGDPMLFTIWYSPDNFTSFYPIANNVPMTPDLDNPGEFEQNNQFTLADLSALPGSATARVRILASDGFNTGIADSGPFELTNRPPNVYITDPNPGQVYDPQFPVNLYGGATDAEDGLLEGDSLSWAIDATEVATGTDALIAGMAPGVYTVTLTATDSTPLSATRSAPLEIAPLSVPQATAPTLDGFCNDAGYGPGSQIALSPYANGDQATLHLQRTAGALWACFTGLQKGDEDPIPVAALRFDVNHDGVDPAQAGDFLFTVGEDGGVSALAGDGAGAFDDPGPAGFAAQISTDINESGPATTWSAELRIDLATLGGPNHLVGLAAGHYSLNEAGNNFVWPYAAQPVTPSTWGATALGSQPIVMGIEPYSATVGSPAIELRIDGDHFAPDAVVVFNGTTITPSVAAAGLDATTEITSATSFAVNIPANLLAAPGDLDVIVRNPGNLDANTMQFTVNNVTPIIKSLSPDQADAQDAGFTLTVTGTGFLNGATVAWEGIDLTTTFVNATSLTANVPADLLEIGGFAAVTVRNPAPVLADSNAVSFKIVGEGEVTPPAMWLPALKRD